MAGITIPPPFPPRLKRLSEPLQEAAINDHYFGVPQTFEEWKAVRERPETWPQCLHGPMRRKIARQGFDYIGFYVCVRDDARCGVINVTQSQVYQQWADERPRDKENN